MALDAVTGRVAWDARCGCQTGLRADRRRDGGQRKVIATTTGRRRAALRRRARAWRRTEAWRFGTIPKDAVSSAGTAEQHAVREAQRVRCGCRVVTIKPDCTHRRRPNLRHRSYRDPVRASTTIAVHRLDAGPIGHGKLAWHFNTRRTTSGLRLGVHAWSIDAGRQVLVVRRHVYDYLDARTGEMPFIRPACRTPSRNRHRDGAKQIDAA